jgi:hypothetical protein
MDTFQDGSVSIFFGVITQYPRQKFTVQLMSLSNEPFDKVRTNSSACANADELVFGVPPTALWVEQSPLRLRLSKLARVLITEKVFDSTCTIVVN